MDVWNSPKNTLYNEGNMTGEKKRSVCEIEPMAFKFTGLRVEWS